MEVLLRIAALGIVSGVLGLVIKKHSPDMALMLAIASAVCILYLAADMIRDVTGFISSLTELAGVPAPSVAAVMKAMAIGIITRLAADVCKDSGQTAVSSAVELGGTAAALFVALPLMKSVLEMIRGIM